MRLIYSDLSIDAKLTYDRINLIVVEKPWALDKFILELKSRISLKSGPIVIEINDSEVDLHKTADIVFSSLDLEYESRLIQKSLFESLSDNLYELGLESDYQDIQTKIFHLIDKVEVSSDINLAYQNDIELNGLFKLLNIGLETGSGSFVEKFIDYSTNLQKLIGKNIFFLVSCSNYLEEEDYRYLLEHQLNRKILIVFIEGRTLNYRGSSNIFILDKDLCVI